MERLDGIHFGNEQPVSQTPEALHNRLKSLPEKYRARVEEAARKLDEALVQKRIKDWKAEMGRIIRAFDGKIVAQPTGEKLLSAEERHEHRARALEEVLKNIDPVDLQDGTMDRDKGVLRRTFPSS